MIMKQTYFRLFILITYIFSAQLIYGIGKNPDSVAIVVNRYKQMSSKQLFDLGESFYSNNIKDSAMICYSLICQRKINKSDTSSMQLVCKSYNRCSNIYFYNCDFQSALELLFKALNTCEEIKYYSYIGRIYNNIGNVYFSFKDINMAKKYYKIASEYYGGEELKASILNNLGAAAYHENKLDSALNLFMEAIKIRVKINDVALYDQFLNIGLINESLGRYDTSLVYYRKALMNAYRLNKVEKIAKSLSSIGQLYSNISKYDSSEYYLVKSNVISQQYRLFDIMSDNLLNISKIEESRGNIKSSFTYYKKHSAIKDSLFNASKYGSINELQFLYDISKIDKKIEALNVEQQTKENIINTQRKVQFIMGISLLIISISFVMLYLKNNKLNIAYNKLFVQNVEIVNSDNQNKKLKEDFIAKLKEKDQTIDDFKKELSAFKNVESTKDFDSMKYKKSSLSSDFKSEISSTIMEIMENKEIFCNPNFSLSKLAEMSNSNVNYVSQIINDTFKKNFRTFLNEYRIKEARQLLSDPNSHKYSIEAISEMVGFRSKSAFNIAFKEVTGITPSFYSKSITNNNTQQS